MFCSWSNWKEKKGLFGMGQSIVLSYKLSLGGGDNISYYKSVHHPIATRGNRKHPGNFYKKVSKLSFQLSVQVYSLLAQTEGEREVFRAARRGTVIWNYPQEYLVVIRDEKVSPFVKFETILPLLCFLLGSLQISTAGHGVINLWIDFRTYQK